jgi:outer membrane protein insertion porin family
MNTAASRSLVARVGGVALRVLPALYMGVAAVALTPAAAVAQAFSFSSIQVEGAQRVDTATVVSYAAIPRGQAISAGDLNDAYQRVLNSGLFQSVELVPQGGTLVIRVVEFPTINEISFEGNRALDDDQLATVVRSQPSRVYNPTTAEQDARLISEGYALQGRIAATVTPRIIRRSDNRVDLVFEITEGRVTEIDRLSFTGNRAFSDRRLRQVLETKQAGIFRALVSRDTFIEERVAIDRQLLRDFYLSRGYVDMQVLSVTPELTEDRQSFFLTFTVQEGQQFRLGGITTTSEVPEIDPAAFGAEVRARSGDVYSPSLIDNTVTRLETLALRQGLDFVRVEPRVTRNERAGTLDVEFAIVRGPRIFVERIDIEGNVTTLDRVVRNQFRSVEGDPFNPREIRQSAERIRALGYFSNANVQARPGSTPDQVIVDVDVEEQPTGSLSFGLSYSVASGAALAVSFSESNFLGRGQTLAFTIDTGDSNTNSNFTFVEPNFLGRDLRFRSNISYRETDNDFSDYSTRIGGLSVGLDFPVGEYARLGLTIGARYDDVYDYAGDSAILEADEAQGGRTLGTLGYSYSHDTRSGGLDPTRGVLLRFGQELYAGDATLLKTSALAVAERRVWNEDVTLRARVEGGAINTLSGEGSRVTDRYFGSEIRGFEPRGIGPRDLDTTGTDGDPLGGNYFAVASLEAEFPLGLPEEYGISGGLFLDVGSVWGLEDVGGFDGTVDDDLNLRAAAGVSIFWTTPIGPLRFNFSTPLVKEEYDQVQNFDLTVSTRF